MPVSLKIDLLDGFVWRGAQVVDFADLYARKLPCADFFVPGPIYDGFMLWIKPLMTGGFIKEKYRDDISLTIKTYPDEFRRLLNKTFGSNTGATVWPYLSQGDLNETIPYQRKLCHSAWLAALRNSPVQTLLATIEHVYREVVRRSVRPRGSMISVIGPDGSGKSTFIDLLQGELSRILVKERRDVCILHFRPNLFPNLKKLLAGRKYDEREENFTSPHRAEPAGVVSSFFRITYYWLDYLLGYWLRLRNRCVAGKVYIFDRYFYDFIVDPLRSRINLPKWLRMFFLRMTPEPDIVFFLNSDAAVIYARKQELVPEEIDRQLYAYRWLVKRSPRFVTLDAGESPEELCKSAVRRLIENSFVGL
jgi:thymidylate kinase